MRKAQTPNRKLKCRGDDAPFDEHFRVSLVLEDSRGLRVMPVCTRAVPDRSGHEAKFPGLCSVKLKVEARSEDKGLERRQEGVLDEAEEGTALELSWRRRPPL